MNVDDTLEFIDEDGWTMVNIRVEIEDGVPDVNLWYSDEWGRCSVPVPDLPRFIAILQGIYDKYKTT